MRFDQLQRRDFITLLGGDTGTMRYHAHGQAPAQHGNALGPLPASAPAKRSAPVNSTTGAYWEDSQHLRRKKNASWGKP
jgi:hypothetical protein